MCKRESVCVRERVRVCKRESVCEGERDRDEEIKKESECEIE